MGTSTVNGLLRFAHDLQRSIAEPARIAAGRIRGRAAKDALEHDAELVGRERGPVAQVRCAAPARLFPARDERLALAPLRAPAGDLQAQEAGEVEQRVADR